MSTAPDREGEIPLASTVPPLPGSAVPPLPVQAIPYASPYTANTGGYAYPTGPIRSGSLIIAPLGCSFPQRCVKCNAPATATPLVRHLTWAPPFAYLALLLGLLLGAIIILLTQKKGTVVYGLCPTHHAERRKRVLLTWLIGLSSPVLLVAAIVAFVNTHGQQDYGAIGVACLLLALGAAIAAGIVGNLARPLSPKRIDAQMMTLKGAGEPFLGTLPVAYGS